MSLENQNTIKRWIDEDYTMSLRTISRRRLNEFSITISKSTIEKTIRDFSYSLKNIHLIPERRNDTGTISQRFLYAKAYISMQARFSESKIIFLDEVGFNVSMTASKVRSQIGTSAIMTRDRKIIGKFKKFGAFYRQIIGF